MLFREMSVETTMGEYANLRDVWILRSEFRSEAKRMWMSPKMAEVGRCNQEAGILLKGADKRSRLFRVS